MLKSLVQSICLLVLLPVVTAASDPTWSSDAPDPTWSSDAPPAPDPTWSSDAPDPTWSSDAPPAPAPAPAVAWTEFTAEVYFPLLSMENISSTSSSDAPAPDPTWSSDAPDPTWSSDAPAPDPTWSSDAPDPTWSSDAPSGRRLLSEPLQHQHQHQAAPAPGRRLLSSNFLSDCSSALADKGYDEVTCLGARGLDIGVAILFGGPPSQLDGVVKIMSNGTIISMGAITVTGGQTVPLGWSLPTQAETARVEQEQRAEAERASERRKTNWGPGSTPTTKTGWGLPFKEMSNLPTATQTSQAPNARKLSSWLYRPHPKQNARRANELSVVWAHIVAMDLLRIELDPNRTETVVIYDDAFYDDGEFTVELMKKQLPADADGNLQVFNKGNGLLDMTWLYSDDAAFLNTTLRMGGSNHPTNPYGRGKLKHAGNDTEASWLNRLMRDPSTGLFIAGDVRINDHAGFSLIAQLMMRNHNRLAETLAYDHSTWDDDRVFEAARVENTHQYQKITCFDLMAASGGDTFAGKYDGGYQPDTKPEVYANYVAINYHNLFATHSPFIPRMDSNYREVEEKFIPNYDIVGSGWGISGDESNCKDRNGNVLTTCDKQDDVLRGFTFQAHQQPDYPSQYFINKKHHDVGGNSVKGGVDMIFDGNTDLVATGIVRMRDWGKVSRWGSSKMEGAKRTLSAAFTDKARQDELVALYFGKQADIEASLIPFSNDANLQGVSFCVGVTNMYKTQIGLSAVSDERWFMNEEKWTKKVVDLIWEFRLKHIVEFNTGVGSSLMNAFFQADGKDNVMSEAVSTGLHDGVEMSWSPLHEQYDNFFQMDPWFGASTRVINNEYIEFLMEAKSLGWISLGFAPAGGHGMLDTDCIRCRILQEADGPVAEIWDMKAYQIGWPKYDPDFDPPGVDDLKEYPNMTKGWEEDGKTLCTFARKLDTNDTYDMPIIRGLYKGTFAYSYMGDDDGYHGPTRGFFETTFWEKAALPVLIVEEDSGPKMIAAAVVSLVLGGAVFGYYYYMKKKGGDEFQLEKAMTEDEQRKKDIRGDINLHIFWLCLDCFDLGSDVASLVFAISGAVGDIVLTYIFAAFVALSIAVSSKVLTTRTKKIIDASQQLRGDANAKIIGNATYKDMFVQLGKSKKSLAAAGGAKVAPAANGEKKEQSAAQKFLKEDEARFKKQLLEYSDAVTGLGLVKWVLILMVLEDLPSFLFNMYFLVAVWPDMIGMETPCVSILITVLSMGYKLSYLQKWGNLKKKKAQEERNFAAVGISQQVLVSAVKSANKKKKKNPHLDGAFA